MVLDQGHVPGPTRAVEPRADLVSTQRAEPGEQRGLTAIGVELVEGADQRQLSDLLRGVVVATQPRPGKPIQTREVRREELLERSLLPREQPASLDQIAHDSRFERL